MLTNAEQFQQLKQDYEQLEFMHSALLEITDLVFKCENLKDFYSRLHNTVSSLMDAENFFVALVDSNRQNLNFVFHQDKKDTNPGLVPISELEGSLSALVLARGKSLLITPKKDQRLSAKKLIKLHGIAGVDWLGVPLIDNDNVVGLMVVQSYTNNVRYQHKDKVFLEFVASHVITALARFKNKEALKSAVANRTRQLEEQLTIIKQNEQVKQVLFEISEMTNAHIGIDQFNERLHQIIGRLLSVENFYIARLDKQENRLKFVYYVDSVNPYLVERRQNKGLKGFTEYLIEQKKPVLLNRQEMINLIYDGIVDKTSKKLSIEEQVKTCSWLGVPLIYRGEVFGAMVVQSYQENVAFTAKDSELLSFVSHHISTAINRKDLADVRRQSQELLEQQVNIRTAELIEEIEQRQIMEKQLKYSATHDELTGLYNRSYFYDVLTNNLAKKSEDSNYNFAVLFIDLDHFKKVNDSLGHHVGDDLLKIVGKKISHLIRNDDTIARLGGDEFAIILDNLVDLNVARQVSNRIVSIVDNTFYIDEHAINIGASIGILYSHDRYTSAEEMLRDADTAMYQAKYKGKGCSEIFDASMHQKVLENLKLEAEIREGINAQEFIPFFQPIFDLHTQNIVGFEALARWQNPRQGLLFPDKFIQCAEDTGLIDKIDLQIMEKAAKIISNWRNRFPSQKIYVCCNVSSSNFLKERMSEQVARLIHKYQLPLHTLAIEVTESALLQNNDVVLANMLKLKELGVKLYLDDFGTGYSSLSYLYKYPFDVLKIDGEFVRKMDEDDKHTAIIKTIIEMSANLGMETVAEGISMQRHVNTLVAFNCQMGQGYHLGKPQPKEIAEQLLLDAAQQEFFAVAKS